MECFGIKDEYYSPDGYDVFYTTDALHVCDTKNFRNVFNDNSEDAWDKWVTDGCFYYIKNYKIPYNDYSHIQLYKGSGGLAKDMQWVYFLNRKINFDDSNKRIIDTVDIASFSVTGYLHCRDKYGCINVYHGREKCE